jgi:chromosome segregation ATPase
MPDASGVAGIAGGIVGFFGVLFGWHSSRRKADVDESAVVLRAWKELLDGHKTELKALKAEFAEYKKTAQAEFDRYKLSTQAEIAGLRERIVSLEGDLAHSREENIGLKAAIRQNSASTAYQLERSISAPDLPATEKRKGKP